MAKLKRAERTDEPDPLTTLKVTVCYEDNPESSWVERWGGYEWTMTQQDAEAECKRLIEKFNKTEKHRCEDEARLRSFVKVEIERPS